MALVDHRAARGADQVRTLALVEGDEDRLAHEPAPTPTAGHSIDIGDELVVHVYVHSHVPKIAPRLEGPQGLRRLQRGYDSGSGSGDGGGGSGVGSGSGGGGGPGGASPGAASLNGTGALGPPKT